jgi:hypothetical protein
MKRNQIRQTALDLMERYADNIEALRERGQITSDSGSGQYTDKEGNIYPININLESRERTALLLARVEALLKNKPLPISKPNRPKQKFDAAEYLQEQNVQDVRVDNTDGCRLVSITYPELRTKTFPPQLAKLNKELTQFRKAISEYEAFLRKLPQEGCGVARKLQDDGTVSIEKNRNLLHSNLTGDVKSCTGTIQKIINEQKRLKANPEITWLRKQLRHESEERQLAQLRDGEQVVVDMPAQPMADRPHSLHDQVYVGQQPELNENSRVVVLDAGVLQRCFGVDAAMQVNELTSKELRQLRNFGREVFDSLVNNPNIDAVIIPDYILDIECCQRTTDYTSGQAEATTMRKKFFSTALENMLKHAVRRWEDERGVVTYMRDATVDQSSINPKIIIWESAAGKQQIKKFEQKKRQYLRSIGTMKSQAEKDALEKPGEDFGEKVIEELINDPEFPAGKKLVISTDYGYVSEAQESEDISRSTFGAYLHSLILSDIPKWEKISGYEDKGESDAMKATNIRDKMRENFNALRISKDDPMSIPFCENAELFREITGLERVSTKVSDVQRKAASKNKIRQ